MFLRFIPLIFSFLLLGAHVLRAGNLILTGVCLCLPLLLLVRRRWSVQVLQILLYIGAAVWIETAIRIARQRIMLGQPWGRMVLILGGVCLFTVVSGLLLRSSTVYQRYDVSSRSRYE